MFTNVFSLLFTNSPKLFIFHYLRNFQSFLEYFLKIFKILSKFTRNLSTLKFYNLFFFNILDNFFKILQNFSEHKNISKSCIFLNFFQKCFIILSNFFQNFSKITLKIFKNLRYSKIFLSFIFLPNFPINISKIFLILF